MSVPVQSLHLLFCIFLQRVEMYRCCVEVWIDLRQQKKQGSAITFWSWSKNHTWQKRGPDKRITFAATKPEPLVKNPSVRSDMDCPVNLTQHFSNCLYDANKRLLNSVAFLTGTTTDIKVQNSQTLDFIKPSNKARKYKDISHGNLKIPNSNK